MKESCFAQKYNRLHDFHPEIQHWLIAPHGLYELHELNQLQAKSVYDFLKSICEFEIREVEFVDNHIHGLCDMDHTVIYINKLISDVYKPSVLLHEIGHLIMHRWHIGSEAVREVQAELFAWHMAEQFGVAQPFLHANYLLDHMKQIQHLDRTTILVEQAIVSFHGVIEQAKAVA